MNGIPEATPVILTAEERAEFQGLARSDKTDRLPEWVKGGRSSAPM